MLSTDMSVDSPNTRRHTQLREAAMHSDGDVQPFKSHEEGLAHGAAASQSQGNTAWAVELDDQILCTIASAIACQYRCYKVGSVWS